MVAGTFAAGMTPATTPLTVSQFCPAPTPGNVGVALSGGGSRALVAAMGQLRALNRLTANGRKLLPQLKALSTVSGGSWLGVPFVYLPPGSATDAAYLGPWVENPDALTPEGLALLPAGNAGVPIASPLFGPVALALQALLLHQVLRVPPDMLWQTLIGLNILAAHGLYAPDRQLAPTDTFSFDAATVSAQITGPGLNPALAAEPIDLYADERDPARGRRPFLICNSAMFVAEAATGLDLLAPVQSTPFWTGIFGTPDGTDANGRRPGGGGIATFGFNSAFAGETETGGVATIAQTRQWSLTDAVGTSSAFFAEVLQNLFAQWRQDPAALAAALSRHADLLGHWIATRLPAEARPHAANLLRLANRVPALPLPLGGALDDLQSLIPRYPSWPVRDPAAPGMPLPDRFADGGNLENSGVAALLAYADIDSVIAFVNTARPLQIGACGVADPAGGFIPGTDVVVDDAIPPLFGYQPYDASRGYQPYAGAPYGKTAMFAHNKVFPAAAFPDLLCGLWQASGNGTSADAAIFVQQLAVQPNAWFGIDAARDVTVVWYHLGFATAWQQLFASNPPVLAIIQAEHTNQSFPNYPTIDTNLSATQVNLLADLTAWAVGTAAAQIAALFRRTAGAVD